MKITEVNLSFVKCFQSLKLDLKKPGTEEPLSVCVLVGANGSGKSTILKSIVSTFTVMDECYNGELFDDNAVRKGSEHLNSTIFVEFTEEEQKRLNVQRDMSYFSYAHLTKQALEKYDMDEEENDFPMILLDKEDDVKEDRYKNFLAEFYISKNDGIVMYLDPFRFLTENTPLGPNFHNMPTTPRDNALSSIISSGGMISNRDMFIKQWLINLDYLVLKEPTEKNKTIYKHIIDAFELLLSPLEFKGINVEGKIIFSDHADNGNIEIDMLSDGFKSIFIIISEIILRLALIECKEEEYFYEKEAIILIDEIDCHIHPKWQKNLIPSLRKLFPNCQFIITTHSPFILETLQEYEIKKIGERNIL